MRVLLVEDDLQIGQSMRLALKNVHYCVDWARDGNAGRLAIDAANYAVVLLDLGSPGVRGIDLLRDLRAAGNPVPVLVLTARDDLETRVCALDSGADDCVLKPFDIRELLARVRAVLRRSAGYATSRIGGELLHLDLERRTLCCKGVTSALSAREFALMHTFMERPGTIFSRVQLEDRIYGWGSEVESNAIDVLIHSMRKKFGQSLIHNIRGLGWTVMRADEAEAA
jgi:two-component system OmpR family response regulator